MLLEPIKRQFLYQQVADQIERFIVDHRLERGDGLPTEVEFARQLRVNRSTVRVAVKGLEMLGILTYSDAKGYSVGSLGLIQLARQFSSYLEEQSDFRDLVETRLFLEVNILPLVAERATESDFKHLQHAVDLLREDIAHKDLGTWIVNDIAFHEALFDASQNRMLKGFAGMVKAFFVDLRRAPFAPFEVTPQERTIREHQGICDALRRKDVRSAQETMTVHLAHYLSGRRVQGESPDLVEFTEEPPESWAISARQPAE